VELTSTGELPKRLWIKSPCAILADAAGGGIVVAGGRIVAAGPTGRRTTVNRIYSVSR